jgi:hypothetical protein
MTKLPCPQVIAAALVATFLVGCGGESGRATTSQGPLPAGYTAPASTENLPLVDHPEYAHWSQFSVGTGVVRKKEVSNEFGTVRVTTTVRLAEKTADKVVVQTQVTVERPESPAVENPPFNAEFAARFRLPAGMKLEQFALPSLKAKASGEETRAVCGRDFQTELFTWDERNEAGPMNVKFWRSDEIPGRMLRQEVNGRTQVSVEEVVEIIQPTGQVPGKS